MPNPLPTPSQDPDEADRATTREMLESGMELAREMARQVQRPNLGWEPADEVAAAYDRLSRGLRRTILYARRADAGTDPERSRQDAAAFRTLLHVLREAGSAIRQGIVRQASTPAPFVPALAIGDAGLALDRLYRALRRTMLLNRILAAHPVPKRHRAPAQRPAAEGPPAPAPTPGLLAAPVANPHIARLHAAHDRLAQADAQADAEAGADTAPEPPDTLDTPERLDTLDAPTPDQLARLQAALASRPRPRAVTTDRKAFRARQSRLIEEWQAAQAPEGQAPEETDPEETDPEETDSAGPENPDPPDRPDEKPG